MTCSVVFIFLLKQRGSPYPPLAYTPNPLFHCTRREDPSAGSTPLDSVSNPFAFQVATLLAGASDEGGSSSDLEGFESKVLVTEGVDVGPCLFPADYDVLDEGFVIFGCVLEEEEYADRGYEVGGWSGGRDGADEFIDGEGSALEVFDEVFVFSLAG